MKHTSISVALLFFFCSLCLGDIQEELDRLSFGQTYFLEDTTTVTEALIVPEGVVLAGASACRSSASGCLTAIRGAGVVLMDGASLRNIEISDANIAVFVEEGIGSSVYNVRILRSKVGVFAYMADDVEVSDVFIDEVPESGDGIILANADGYSRVSNISIKYLTPDNYIDGRGVRLYGCYSVLLSDVSVFGAGTAIEIKYSVVTATNIVADYCDFGVEVFSGTTLLLSSSFLECNYYGIYVDGFDSVVLVSSVKAVGNVGCDFAVKHAKEVNFQSCSRADKQRYPMKARRR